MLTALIFVTLRYVTLRYVTLRYVTLRYLPGPITFATALGYGFLSLSAPLGLEERPPPHFPMPSSTLSSGAATRLNSAGGSEAMQQTPRAPRPGAATRTTRARGRPRDPLHYVTFYYVFYA